MDGAKLPRRLPPGSPREFLNQKLDSATTAEKGIEAHPKDILALDDVASGENSVAELNSIPQQTPVRENYISLEEAVSIESTAEPATPPAMAGIVGSHLNGKQMQHAKEFARRLAATGKRVGVIELSSTEISLIRFEADTRHNNAQSPVNPGDFSTRKLALVSPRQITDALEEMTSELDQWLMVFPGARGNELRLMLGELNHWIMLSSCDHDGLVSCYRSLKGALDQQINHSQNQFRPRLSLALIDGVDQSEMDKVYRKISSVCKQFMQYSVDKEFPAESSTPVSEYLMLRTAIADSARFAVSPQWQAVMQFMRAQNHGNDMAPTIPPENSKSKDQMPSDYEDQNDLELSNEDSNQNTRSQHVSTTAPLMNELSDLEHEASATEEFDPVAPIANRSPRQSPSQSPNQSPKSAPPANRSGPTVAHGSTKKPAPSYRTRNDHSDEAISPSRPRQGQLGRVPVSTTDAVADVIELPDENASCSAIVSAVLRSRSSEMVECPITPPICPDARLAVNRDRQLVVVAASGHGLCDLRSIARAYQWLVENHKILCMALPQYAIDASIKPAMYLLVDHGDMNSELMQPLFETETVSIHGYRRLRWGARAGLLLEAA